MARKVKTMENEKHPLDDLKNDEITKKCEKWEIHTEGPDKWVQNPYSSTFSNTFYKYSQQ